MTAAPNNLIPLSAGSASAGVAVVPFREPRRSAEQSAPLFLHSSFRTGSTWLWQKLRDAPTTFCYYEIFHELLKTISIDTAKSVDDASWPSRHPIAAPYFLEFIPHIGGAGGVAGFDEAMTFADFIPAEGPDGALRPASKSYVEGLIELARSRKRIPLLSCTRSLGRARALRAAVGGNAIFLHRNLFHQWASYWALAEAGNPYFVDTMLRIILASGHDPFLQSVTDWFQLDRRPPTGEVLFQVFIILHLYLYGIAHDASDLMVDITAMASDRVAREEVEHQLSDMTGAAIDLSDLREECVFTSFTDASPNRVRDVIEQFMKLMPTASTTHKGLTFVQQAMERSLSEWDRFEFFNRRMRSVLIAQLDATKLSLKERDARIDSLESEKVRLALAVSEAERALDALRTENEHLARHAVEADHLGFANADPASPEASDLADFSTAST